MMTHVQINRGYRLGTLEMFGKYINTSSKNKICVNMFVHISDWLVGWVLWQINLSWLFSAKSSFMKIVLFQIIQFSISTQFKCKYSLIVKNISISSYSV